MPRRRPSGRDTVFSPGYSCTWTTSYNWSSPTREHPPCSHYCLRTLQNSSWEACLCLVPSTTSVAASAMFSCNGELVGRDEVPAEPTPPHSSD